MTTEDGLKAFDALIVVLRGYVAEGYGFKCELKADIRESTPSALECMAQHRPLPEYKEYESHGVKTITLRLFKSDATN